VLADGKVVGPIFKAAAAPVSKPWMWTLAHGQHEDRMPTHGYEAINEAAIAAFAKSWRREKTCEHLRNLFFAFHMRVSRKKNGLVRTQDFGPFWRA
jgi:hypothetical protein